MLNAAVQLMMNSEDIRIPGQCLYEESTAQSPTMVIITLKDGTVQRHMSARPYLMPGEPPFLGILSQPTLLAGYQADDVLSVEIVEEIPD